VRQSTVVNPSDSLASC